MAMAALGLDDDIFPLAHLCLLLLLNSPIIKQIHTSCMIYSCIKLHVTDTYHVLEMKYACFPMQSAVTFNQNLI